MKKNESENYKSLPVNDILKIYFRKIQDLAEVIGKDPYFQFGNTNLLSKIVSFEDKINKLYLENDQRLSNELNNLFNSLQDLLIVINHTEKQIKNEVAIAKQQKTVDISNEIKIPEEKNKKNPDEIKYTKKMEILAKYKLTIRAIDKAKTEIKNFQTLIAPLLRNKDLKENIDDNQLRKRQIFKEILKPINSTSDKLNSHKKNVQRKLYSEFSGDEDIIEDEQNYNEVPQQQHHRFFDALNNDSAPKKGFPEEINKPKG